MLQGLSLSIRWGNFFYNKYQDKIDFWKNKNKAMTDKKNTKPGVLDTASKEMKTAVFSVLLS